MYGFVEFRISDTGGGGTLSIWTEFIVCGSLVNYIFTTMLFEPDIRSVVRAFAHGAMGRQIDPSCGEPIELFLVPASAPQLV